MGREVRGAVLAGGWGDPGMAHSTRAAAAAAAATLALTPRWLSPPQEEFNLKRGTAYHWDFLLLGGWRWIGSDWRGRCG